MVAMLGPSSKADLPRRARAAASSQDLDTGAGNLHAAFTPPDRPSNVDPFGAAEDERTAENRRRARPLRDRLRQRRLLDLLRTRPGRRPRAGPDAPCLPLRR